MEIKVNGKLYYLPEGFTVHDTKADRYYISPAGDRFILHSAGYRAVDDCPFLEEKVLTGLGRRIPLEVVNPTDSPEVKTGEAWLLSHKLLNMLMVDGKLSDDYGSKLEVVEAEFDKFGDADLKAYVLPRIKNVVEEYKRTKVWNLVLLGN